MVIRIINSFYVKLNFLQPNVKKYVHLKMYTFLFTWEVYDKNIWLYILLLYNNWILNTKLNETFFLHGSWNNEKLTATVLSRRPYAISAAIKIAYDNTVNEPNPPARYCSRFSVHEFQLYAMYYLYVLLLYLYSNLKNCNRWNRSNRIWVLA